MQSVRHYFPGANTPKGFVSYYDEILPSLDAGRLAVIKGGPGTGKSTLLKQTASLLAEQGETVDYLHCSSDPHSLDGIYLPKYHSAAVDGTAPHIVDARYPGACDSVWNVCQWLDASAMKPQAQEIIRLNREISAHFQDSYRYLASCRCVMDVLETRSRARLIPAEVNHFAEDIARQAGAESKEPRERTMFLSALTHGGIVSYQQQILEDCFVTALWADTGDAAGDILSAVALRCRQRGISTEIYCCPMNPGVPEHLVFCDAHLALTVSNPSHTYQKADRVVYFSDFCRPHDDAREEKPLCHTLLESAVACLRQAKTKHDRLEEYYIPHMDFAAVSQLARPLAEFLVS